MIQLLDPAPWPLPALLMAALVTILASYFLLLHASHRRFHPSEPPIISPPLAIPYLGHLLLMALHGGHSVRQLGLKHSNLPIFTLAVPFSRLYIVTSPSLAAAVQRKPTTQLSFNALLPHIVQRVMGLDSATRAIVARDMDPERGQQRGFLADLHDTLVLRLGPGAAMEALTLRAVDELGEGLDAYAASLPKEDEERPAEDLLHWVRHLVTHATARLLYGTRNPLALHPTLDLEEAFWDFDHGLGRLLMGMWPSVTASKAYAGREALVAAFRAYVEARHDEHEPESGAAGIGADEVVLERIRIARAHGFSVDGIARSELSFLFAGIVNTATTTFWTLARIFADRELLRLVREELAVIAAPVGESKTRRLSLKQLTKGCPRLCAVYREVLRVGSNTFSTRLVKEDTVLTAAGVPGEVWLSKGGVVQIAGGVMHGSRAIWGDDVDAFHPGRHLEADGGNQNEDGTVNVHPAAFRAFGGGRTMCPGRHFATGEILGLVGHVLMRFEMEGVDETGEITVPEVDDYVLPVHILEPVAGSPVRVRIRLRDEEDGERIEIVP